MRKKDIQKLPREALFQLSLQRGKNHCYTAHALYGVEITTNSEEIYAECEKGESYQAIVKIATHKKNGKKLYFLENVADKPVSKAVKE